MEGTYVNVFSTSRPDAMFETIKVRAIVEHIGVNTGEGVWSCTKDVRAINCMHIKTARQYLQQLLTGDLNAEDPAATDGMLQYTGELPLIFIT